VTEPPPSGPRGPIPQLKFKYETSPPRPRLYGQPAYGVFQIGVTEEEMLTWSSYTLSGSPQQCAFCRRPFPAVDGRREAFHSRAAGGYFCDAECARSFVAAAAEHPERRAA
jgi:hypothetical protein